MFSTDLMLRNTFVSSSLTLFFFFMCLFYFVRENSVDIARVLIFMCDPSCAALKTIFYNEYISNSCYYYTPIDFLQLQHLTRKNVLNERYLFLISISLACQLLIYVVKILPSFNNILFCGSSISLRLFFHKLLVWRHGCAGRRLRKHIRRDFTVK